jgi:hypothetical protein
MGLFRQLAFEGEPFRQGLRLVPRSSRPYAPRKLSMGLFRQVVVDLARRRGDARLLVDFIAFSQISSFRQNGAG